MEDTDDRIVLMLQQSKQRRYDGDAGATIRRLFLEHVTDRHRRALLCKNNRVSL
jgi:hypothetical protein